MSETSFNQYFSTRPKISITMPDGGRIYFVGGQYITDKPKEIEFLNEQVALGHPMIYVQKGKETVTQAQLDPLAAVKARAIAEYVEQQAKQQNPARDMGATASTGAGSDIATTATIAPITVGSKNGK